MCIQKTFCIFLLCMLGIFLSGCADKKSSGTEGVTFQKIAGYTDQRGQGRIRVYTFSGEPEIEDIKMHTEKLGCGMLFVYYYPESMDLSEMPLESLETAKSTVAANDLLHKGEGVSRWRFGAQCLSIIPSITDCMETPISTNCR